MLRFQCIFKRVESLDQLECHVLLLAVDKFYAQHLEAVRSTQPPSPFHVAQSAIETIIEKTILVMKGQVC